MSLPELSIRDLSFNISNYCLSSCRNCTLWHSKHWNLDDEMALKTIDRMFLADPILNDLTTIHITGGAPMLSPKFLPVCEMIAKYHPDVPINSPISGLYPEVTRIIMKKVVKILPQYRLNIALEGYNKETHEKVRGPDTWEPMLTTVEYMQRLGVNFRFNFTFYPENYTHIYDVNKIAEDMSGNPLYINFGRFSRRFGNKNDAIRKIPQDMFEFIEASLYNIGWIRQRRLNEQKWILQKAFYEGKKVVFQCRGGSEFIDVDPWGGVWACLMYPPQHMFGNLKYATLSDIMKSSTTLSNRKVIWGGSCSVTCPFTCSLRVNNVTVDGKKVWD